jgi:serine/threonine protein kinase
VKEIFAEALDAERAQVLSSACDGDAELRAEVEQLLASHAEPSLQSPLAKLFPDRTELSAGDTVGNYTIESKLGEGGMGVVYLANDSRLRRSVAIKFVNARFDKWGEREGRAVAALNHPNICTLYDVGPNYLVMELVEGPTLAERIRKGAIPLDEALAIARQIVDGLAAAHDRGIVHRDLKPANIKVKPDGTAKVLDFGLAKISATEVPTVHESTATISDVGLVVGTTAYMAPEQARAEPLDKRADIWAFGCVLYEMLTGKPAFTGATTTDVFSGGDREKSGSYASARANAPPVTALPGKRSQKAAAGYWGCLGAVGGFRQRRSGDRRFPLAPRPTRGMGGGGARDRCAGRVLDRLAHHASGGPFAVAVQHRSGAGGDDGARTPPPSSLRTAAVWCFRREAPMANSSSPHVCSVRPRPLYCPALTAAPTRFSPPMASGSRKSQSRVERRCQ